MKKLKAKLKGLWNNHKEAIILGGGIILGGMACVLGSALEAKNTETHVQAEKFKRLWTELYTGPEVVRVIRHDTKESFKLRPYGEEAE